MTIPDRPGQPAPHLLRPLAFSASLSFLFSDVPFADRLDAARRAGFRAVEFMSPYEESPAALAHKAQEAGVQIYLFNVPSGDWERGERGLAALPTRTNDFRDGVRRATEYASELGVTLLNCLAGRREPDLPWDTQFGCLIDNLHWAVDFAEGQGCSLLIEMVNSSDVPGFFLDSLAVLDRALAEVGPRLLAQLDCYHLARSGEDVASALLPRLNRAGHLQIADVPGRHQPGTGAIDYRSVLAAVAGSGYQGRIGLEYVPTGPAGQWFSWIGEYGYRLGDK